MSLSRNSICKSSQSQSRLQQPQSALVKRLFKEPGVVIETTTTTETTTTETTTTETTTATTVTTSTKTTTTTTTTTTKVTTNTTTTTITTTFKGKVVLQLGLLTVVL